MLIDFKMKEHAAFTTGLGDSDGYLFRHHND